MNTRIQKQIEDWKFIQSLPLDVLNILTDDQLSFTVGKNMGALGEQFRHMARVRFQYVEGIENKRITDVIEKIDPAIAKSKEQLVELWDKANQKLLTVLNKINQDDGSLKIDWKHWGMDSMNLEDHLNVLMDHETLHSGQIIVYIRTMDLKFPKSWEAWGL